MVNQKTKREDIEPDDFTKLPKRADLNKATLIEINPEGLVAQASVNDTNKGHTISGFSSEDEQEKMMNNYWGSKAFYDEKGHIVAMNNRRHYFPIDFYKLDQLFLASPTREVILKVRNIHNKFDVELEWLSYDGMDIQVSNNELYFSLPLEAYAADSLYRKGTYVVDGMRYNNFAQIIGAVIGCATEIQRDENGSAINTDKVNYCIFVGGLSVDFVGVRDYIGIQPETGGGAGGTVGIPPIPKQ
jgi:hypothetical protein